MYENNPLAHFEGEIDQIGLANILFKRNLREKKLIRFFSEQWQDTRAFFDFLKELTIIGIKMMFGKYDENFVIPSSIGIDENSPNLTDFERCEIQLLKTHIDFDELTRENITQLTECLSLAGIGFHLQIDDINDESCITNQIAQDMIAQLHEQESSTQLSGKTLYIIDVPKKQEEINNIEKYYYRIKTTKNIFNIHFSILQDL